MKRKVLEHEKQIIKETLLGMLEYYGEELIVNLILELTEKGDSSNEFN